MEQIRSSLYVDDMLSGADNVQKGFELYQQSKELMAKGAFNLRKWNSNSPELRHLIKKKEAETVVQPKTKEPSQAVKEEDESFTKSTIGPNQVSHALVKTLGVCWDTASDEISFDFTDLIECANAMQVTKRSLLKLSAKVFDPLGLLSPFTITMKCLFQSLCLEKLDWDVELQGNYVQLWKSFVSSLIHLNSVHVPRCYLINIQIYAFSDVSKKAYAAAVYLRSEYQDGNVDVKLVSSKTRVAPMKQQTIPRLELLGALISARLVSSLMKSLPQEIEPTFWVDSTTVLYWVQHEKPWKQYVQNRVQEIRKIVPQATWKHCPGDKNPADLPSRGLTGKELVESSMWWCGPDFLMNPENEWPKASPSQTSDEQAMVEMVKCPSNVTHSLLSSLDNSTMVDIGAVIEPKNYSSQTRLLRITAYVLRFASNLKARLSAKPTQVVKELSAAEIDRAEFYWIKSVQARSFEEEIQFLKKKSQLSPLPRIQQFGLYLDEDGVLRCKGRLGHTDLPSTCKNPILLPSKNDFVNLLIKDVHFRVKHSEVRDTLTALRETYWVLRGREATKRIMKGCVICRKFEAVPFKPHPTPDLPEIRVADSPPFTYTGVDFAGPLYVTVPKEPQSAEKNFEKTYICLFTCASTRAIHLELTRDLGVNSFLQAFRRFSSRRGLPSTLVSDNAKTFKAGSKEVQKMANSPEVQRHFANNRVTWNFVVEKAPWWGGFWERLVKSVKRNLKKTVGRASLNYDELNTLVIEIEGLLNARPITYIYDDDDALAQPLTPSHLISGRKINVLPNDEHFEIISTHNTLTRRQRRQRQLLQQFARQWRREYLLSLRERAITKSGGGNPSLIQVGDVVILKDDSTARAFWKMGKVEELLPGDDGKVRAAVVRVPRRNGTTQLLKRVIQHLIPLEVRVESTDNQVPGQSCAQVPGLQQVIPSIPNTQRPRREAAIRGENLRRELMKL